MELVCRLRYISNPHSTANDLPNPKGCNDTRFVPYPRRTCRSLFIRYAIVGVLVKCFRCLLLLTHGMWCTRDLETLWIPEFRGNDGLDDLRAYRSERGWSPVAFIHTSVLQRTDPLESDYRHGGQEAQGRECERPLIVACHDV